jgi:hypothetical protein
VAELIPVVKLFDLFKICLVIAIAEKRYKTMVSGMEKGDIRYP